VRGQGKTLKQCWEGELMWALACGRCHNLDMTFGCSLEAISHQHPLHTFMQCFGAEGRNRSGLWQR
jgi:hypothetical protein